MSRLRNMRSHMRSLRIKATTIKAAETDIYSKRLILHTSRQIKDRTIATGQNVSYLVVKTLRAFFTMHRLRESWRVKTRQIAKMRARHNYMIPTFKSARFVCKRTPFSFADVNQPYLVYSRRELRKSFKTSKLLQRIVYCFEILSA